MTAFDDNLAQTQPHLPAPRALVSLTTSPSENAAATSNPPLRAGAAIASRKHSGWGIVSFIGSLLVGAWAFLSVALAAIMVAFNPYLDQTSPPAILVGLMICATFPASLLGMLLGGVGLFQRDRRKVFPILGILLNVLVLVSLALLMFIGSQTSSALASPA